MLTAEGVKYPAPIKLDEAGLRLESQGWQRNAYVYRIRAISPGRFRVVIHTPSGPDERTIHVLSDATDLRDAGTEARDALDERFDKALQRLTQASQAFHAAYARYGRDLAAAEKALARDEGMALRFLVFAIAGFVSGGTSVLSAAATQAMSGAALGAGVRYLIEGMAGGLTGNAVQVVLSKTSVAAGIRGVAHSAGNGGEFTDAMGAAASYENPSLFFLNLTEALLNAKRRLRGDLSAVSRTLRLRATQSSKALFDSDPLALASKPDRLLDGINGRSDAEWQQEIHWTRFYEALWALWVRTNYYSLAMIPGNIWGGVPYWRAEPTSPQVDKVLDTAARTCGYADRHAFLAKYGNRQAKVEEAARRNRLPGVR